MMIDLNSVPIKYDVKIDEIQTLQHLAMLRFKSIDSESLELVKSEKFDFQVIFESSIPELIECFNLNNLPKAVRFKDSYANLIDELNTYQQLGYGVFVNVNDFNVDGSKYSDCTNINALFIDYDSGKQIEIPNMFEHSFEIETNKGLHRYWLVDNQNFDAKLFQIVEQELIEYYQADPKCSNINRILRLAGSYHLKSDNVSQYHLNKITINSSVTNSISEMYKSYCEVNFQMDPQKYRDRICNHLNDSFIRNLLKMGPIWFNSKSVTEEFDKIIQVSILESKFRSQINFKYVKSDYFNISAQFIKYCNDHSKLNTTALRLYHLLRFNYEENHEGRIDLAKLDRLASRDPDFYQNQFNIQCRQTFKRYIKLIGKYLGRVSQSKRFLYLKSPFAVLIEQNYPIHQSFKQIIRAPKSCLESNSLFKQNVFEIYQRQLNGRNIQSEINRIAQGKEVKLFSRKSRAAGLGISAGQLLKYEKLQQTPKILLKRYTPLQPARIKLSNGKSVRNSCTFQQLKLHVNQSGEFKHPYRILVKRDKYWNWIAEEQLGHAYCRLPGFQRISNRYINSVSTPWIDKCIDKLITNCSEQLDTSMSAPSINEAFLGVNSVIVVLQSLLNISQLISCSLSKDSNGSKTSRKSVNAVIVASLRSQPI